MENSQVKLPKAAYFDSRIDEGVSKVFSGLFYSDSYLRLISNIQLSKMNIDF
jgi:hypothetical protein